MNVPNPQSWSCERYPTMQPRGMDALARRHGFWLVALLALLGIGIALVRKSPAPAERDLAVESRLVVYDGPRMIGLD